MYKHWWSDAPVVKGHLYLRISMLEEGGIVQSYLTVFSEWIMFRDWIMKSSLVVRIFSSCTRQYYWSPIISVRQIISLSIPSKLPKSQDNLTIHHRYNLVFNKIQSSVEITGFNITWNSIQHRRNSGSTLIERTMGCLLWEYWRKSHCISMNMLHFYNYKVNTKIHMQSLN